MRLATYNIRHALGPDGSTDPGRYARAVRELDADILALQEVERGAPRSGRVDHVALAADALGASDARFAPTVRRFGPLKMRASHSARHGSLLWNAARLHPAGLGVSSESNSVSDSPEAPIAHPPAPDSTRSAWYGIGVVSRYPVLHWERLELPLESSVHRLRAGLRRRFARDAGTGRRPLPMPDEPRVALVAVVRAPFGEMTVVATHLTVRGGGAAGQLRHLVDACAGYPRPLVLLGDLNMADEAPADVTGWLPLATAPTFPLQRPTRQIDHILVDGDALGAVSGVQSVDTGLSDHRALIVDLTE